MTNLTLAIPETQFNLYKDGFDGKCHLGRKSEGAQLSDLVQRVDNPMVVALDGPWGSGKSFFLKCWVGEHTKTHSESATTVYFDAFKDDFLDDPLISIVAALSERLAVDEETDPVSSAVAKGVDHLDLSRFDAAPLIAFTAPKESYYGTEAYGRIPPRCGAYRANKWSDARTGG